MKKVKKKKKGAPEPSMIRGWWIKKEINLCLSWSQWLQDIIPLELFLIIILSWVDNYIFLITKMQSFIEKS